MNLWRTHTLRLPALLSVGVLLTLAAGANHTRAHAAGSGLRVDWAAGLHEDDGDMVGFTGHGSDSKKPKVEAFVNRESYPRGGNAQLVIANNARSVSLQIFHPGAESDWTMANDDMFGAPVTALTSIGRVHGKLVVRIHLGSWPSGVYFAKLTAAGRRVGYAPFVLSPRHWGEHKVAIVLTNYRNRGGNLMFLCANNFFRRVDIHAGVMTLIGQWRDLGRHEASLIGVEHYHNDEGEHRGPWIVQKTATRVHWLFENTDLSVGSSFSLAGMEADHVTSASPRHVVVVAKVPNLYEDGRDAHMTDYETPAGAKVFAAGAFSLTSAIGSEPVKTLMENLWEKLSKD
jgi:hypothetical protein